MLDFWTRRTALMTLVAAAALLWWPQSAEEADVLASPEAPASVEEQAPMQAAGTTSPEVTDAEASQVPLPDVNVSSVTPDPRELFAKLMAGDRTGGAAADETGYRKPEQPTVYITFDDGPSQWTPNVLDILKEYEIPATFFVLGELAEKREETVRRIVREGHALGNHTYNHKYAELYQSFDAFWQQVEHTGDILEGITGDRVTLFRAPGGTATNFDAFYFYYMTAAGYSIYDWSVDSGDSKRRGVPAAEIVANVKGAPLTHEMTVLLHDGAGHGETVKALPEIIEYFKEKGYRFAALSEEVKPAMFSVRKVKWERTVDWEEHNRLLAMVEEARAAADDWVPLRAFAEREAIGEVHWDAAAETATLDLGGEALRMDVRTGETSRLSVGGTSSVIPFPFKLADGRIYILKPEAEHLAAAGGSEEKFFSHNY